MTDAREDGRSRKFIRVSGGTELVFGGGDVGLLGCQDHVRHWVRRERDEEGKYIRVKALVTSS